MVKVGDLKARLLSAFELRMRVRLCAYVLRTRVGVAYVRVVRVCCVVVRLHAFGVGRWAGAWWYAAKASTEPDGLSRHAVIFSKSFVAEGPAA